MGWQIIRVNSKRPEQNVIQKAAKIIKKGGLVAFPTETVYGLGANALDKKAVRKIFKVKGRPLDNPIIIHIADYESIFKIVKNIPKTAEILVRKFWPGPLTLVLFKKKIIPAEVTAGANTVAIRMPRNKIALELIKTAAVPIAAPSANLAGRPSPTTAQHVFDDLGDKIDIILDGGLAKIGVESTVVDLTVKPPQILRPGGISFEELKKVLKDLKLHPSLMSSSSFFVKKGSKEKLKSPGMKYRHYAPRAKLALVARGRTRMTTQKYAGKIKRLVKQYKKQGKKVGVMITKETKKFLTSLKDRKQGRNYRKNRPLTGLKNGDIILVVGSRKNLKEISRNLFKTLRKFDKMKVDLILAETFSEKGIGFAIMHRLKKAATKVET